MKRADRIAKSTGNVVVINDSYGGFGLSREALRLMQERTGKRWDEDRIPRHHPVLVEIVRELGSQGASGSTAKLKLYRLSGNKYKIDEYDGMETPLEPQDIRWVSTSKFASSKTANPFLRSLDPDQERLAEELHLMAENDGAAYQKKDAKMAVKKAIRELRRTRISDLDYDMKKVAPLVQKSLEARWRQADKGHRMNQRAASMKKAALVRVAMERAKRDPVFRRKLIARLQMKKIHKFVQRVKEHSQDQEGVLHDAMRMLTKMSDEDRRKNAKDLMEVLSHHLRDLSQQIRLLKAYGG